MDGRGALIRVHLPSSLFMLNFSPFIYERQGQLYIDMPLHIVCIMTSIHSKFNPQTRMTGVQTPEGEITWLRRSALAARLRPFGVHSSFFILILYFNFVCHREPPARTGPTQDLRGTRGSPACSAIVGAMVTVPSMHSTAGVGRLSSGGFQSLLRARVSQM